MHLSAAPWPCVWRWFKFKSCFWLCTHALEKWFSKCFSKAVTGFGHKVAIFRVWQLLDTYHLLLEEQLLQDNAEDLSQDCLCCSLLPAQAKSQKMSWNGAASLWLICDWPQSADKHAAASFKRCEALGEGECVFCLFPAVMVTTGRVCAISCSVPAVPLTASVHFLLSDTSCDKTPPVVEPRNSQESRKVVWLRVSGLTAVIDADWNSLLRSFHSQQIGIGSHTLHNQEKERYEEAPLPHLRRSPRPVWGMTYKCPSETTRSTLMVTFWG